MERGGERAAGGPLLGISFAYFLLYASHLHSRLAVYFVFLLYRFSLLLRKSNHSSYIFCECIFNFCEMAELPYALFTLVI